MRKRPRCVRDPRSLGQRSSVRSPVRQQRISKPRFPSPITMKILVTGGGGFLGQALCRGLRGRGHEVVSLSRGRYPALDALAVAQMQGDLAHRDAVLAAARGCEAVFHNAAKAGAWGDYDSYHRANVVGTQHVIDACREHGIRRLVYTSTPSVTHRATHPVEGGSADGVPYGENLKAPYARTKQIAEKLVLAANDASLATVALRPRLIWGVGDNHLLPRLAERARAGRLRLVGDGGNRIDTTYIDNAAQAHFDAFDHLVAGAAMRTTTRRPSSARNPSRVSGSSASARLSAASSVRPASGLRESSGER
jgi:nucleoside-diphosphate-sugar epimerase